MASEFKKRGLGKGLGALLGGTPQAPAPAPSAPASPPVQARLSDGSRLIEIDPSAIKPNPKQPRLVFDEAALEELADSIRRDGVQEPVVVRPAGDGGYELISGERRVRASVMADRALIPAVVRDIPDTDLLRLGLIENLQRENLNPIETAKAYDQLLREFNWTQERLAAEVGKKRASVANTLRLLQLDEAVQEQVASGALSFGHAKLLLGIQDGDTQIRTMEKILARGLSVRETEDLVTRLTAVKTVAKRAPSPTPRKDPNLLQIEDDLRRRFGRKVGVHASESGSGTVELAFFSWDDLDALLEKLKGTK